MQRIVLAVAGVLTVLGLVGVVEGQTLRAGQTVRVRLSDGRRFEARLVGVDSSPLVLRFRQSPHVVPSSSIDSLWLRRSSTGRGALIGGIVLGAVSLPFWTYACYIAGCLRSWGVVVALTGGSAAIGAGLGAGIGSLFPRWQPLGHPVRIAFGVGNSSLKAGARIPF
jgi:hypothetical protein